MQQYQRIDLQDATLIANACQQKAKEIGVDMDIAVTDDAGYLLLFQRMENGRLTSIDIAITKAFTAAAARKSTRDYSNAAQPGKPAFGIQSSNLGRFMIVPGGLPLFVGDKTVGAVGCSSGTPDQDEIVAQAGVDAFLTQL